MHNEELDNQLLDSLNITKKFQNKFIALLPEVAKRQLYLEHGMSSIYEFASELALLPKDTVDRVLKLSENLESKPILKAMFETGKIDWERLEAAIKLALPEKELLEMLSTDTD